MATYSSILAWRTPWTEELGRLQSTGLQKELDMTEWLTLYLHNSFRFGSVYVYPGTSCYLTFSIYYTFSC